MPGDIWDFVNGGTALGLPIPNDPLPLVCVTTTAGTGSEVDAGGVLSCEDNDEKLRLGDPRLFPVLSIVDPELMVSVPTRLTAYQGFDALFHCVECYISNTNTPMGDMVCREGIRRVAAALLRASIMAMTWRRARALRLPTRSAAMPWMPRAPRARMALSTA